MDESVRSALSMRLKREASFRRWTYLMHISQRRVGRPVPPIAFHAPDYPDEYSSPIRRAVLSRPAATPQPGMLTLTAVQYIELTDDRIRKNRRFTMDFLRDTAAEETASMSDAELYDFVRRAESSGFGIRLQSDFAHGLWAFFLLSFGEHLADNPDITQPIRDADDPDNAMEELMEKLAKDAGNVGDHG